MSFSKFDAYDCPCLSCHLVRKFLSLVSFSGRLLVFCQHLMSIILFIRKHGYLQGVCDGGKAATSLKPGFRLIGIITLSIFNCPYRVFETCVFSSNFMQTVGFMTLSYWSDPKLFVVNVLVGRVFWIML